MEERKAQESFLDSIYVRLGDGRLGHPASGKWVDEITHPNPHVWDGLEEFTKFVMPDGSPSQAMTYQRQFLQDTTEMSAFIGGVGSGKTVPGIYRLVDLALLNPGGLTIIGAAAASLLSYHILPEVEKHVPSWAIKTPSHAHLEMKYFKLNQFRYFEMLWVNGHRTIALTLDTKTGAYKKVQGPEACGLWLDEASIISEKAMKVFMERLRDEKGMFYQGFFTTSPDDPGWLEDFFVKGEPDRTKFALVEATTEEATFRTPAYYERLKRIYTVDEYERKVLGKLVSYTGLVYKDHLSTAKDSKAFISFVPDPTIPITIGVDLGYRRSAYVVGQEIIINDMIVDVIFDEAQLSDTTAPELGEHLSTRYKDWNIDFVYTDYSAMSAVDREDLVERMPGSRIEPAIDTAKRGYYRVQQGVSLVRHRCRDHKKKRHLYLASPLRGNVGRGSDNMSLVEALDTYEEPVHKDRIHVLDALRYYILGKYVRQPTVYVGDRQ